MTIQELHDQEPRPSTEIESDIRQTRGRMDATLDELGDRLTARSLINSALDWWESPNVVGRGVAKDAYRTVARFAKEHPIPSLLMGAALAWMIIDSTTSEEDTGESGGGTFSKSTKDTLEHAKEAVTQVAGAAKEKAAALSTTATEAAEDMGRRAQDVYQQSRSTALKVRRDIQRGYHSGAEQLGNAIEEYPLAVGIGFAALGALVGVLLPRTRREDELLGEQSDQLIKATKEKGQELLERGKVVAERLAGSALEQARQQGLTPEAAGETVSGMIEKVGDVVRKVKEEAETAAKDEGLTIEHLKRKASSTVEGAKKDRPAGAQKKSDEQG